MGKYRYYSRPAAVILMSKSLSFGSGVGKDILVKGFPISVRTRAVWDAIVPVVKGCFENVRLKIRVLDGER